MAGRTILIVGGGFGGAAAALSARRALGPSHRVVLIDRQRRTCLCGSLPLLMIGERDGRKVMRSLASLRRHGIDFVQGEVSRIDVGGRFAVASGRRIPWDYLVLATGAEYDWKAVPGAAGGHSFYGFEVARRLRRRLRAFRGGRIVIAVSGTPYKCPPAPFEAALLLSWFVRQRGLGSDVEIHVYTPEPKLLPIAGPQAAAALLADLESRGIRLHTSCRITQVAPGGRGASFGDGRVVDAELVITIPVHRAPAVVRDTGLADPAGWIPVTPGTLATSAPGVYAIGDVSAVPMTPEKGLPKAGVFASAAGETVGHNIAAEINGTAPVAFPGVGQCYVMYTPGRAAMLQGRFLADGSPQVRFEGPTPAGGRHKERFEADWRAFRI